MPPLTCMAAIARAAQLPVFDFIARVVRLSVGEADLSQAILDSLVVGGAGPESQVIPLAVALRTMVVKDNIVHVQAGCGVVADSDPDTEYEETLSKARALISAIELTAQRVSAPSS